SDAPAPVIRLLARHRPRVVVGSKCRAKIEEGMQVGVLEAGTLAPAWIIGIDALDVISPDSVIVHTRYYVAELFAAGWRCLAVRRGGQWSVDRCEPTWVS